MSDYLPGNLTHQKLDDILSGGVSEAEGEARTRAAILASSMFKSAEQLDYVFKLLSVGNSKYNLMRENLAETLALSYVDGVELNYGLTTKGRKDVLNALSYIKATAHDYNMLVNSDVKDIFDELAGILQEGIINHAEEA